MSCPEWTNEDFRIVGYIPQFFNDEDERSAKEQVNRAYAHGGGFQPFEGFTLNSPERDASLSYPDDPPMKEVSRTKLRDETIILFQHAWLAIVQPDGSFEVARID